MATLTTLNKATDNLKFAVIGAIIIDAIIIFLLAALGTLLPVLVVLALAGAVYWFVYRNLATNIGNAKLGAIVCGAIHACFALFSIAFPLFLVLYVAATVCLGYVFLQLQRISPT
jgi:hypothetical protein